MKVKLIVLAFALCTLAVTASGQSIVNQWSTGGTFPGGIDYDSGSGTIWVADETAQMIQQFDRNGVLLKSFTSPRSMPIGVGVDPATGNVWIGDESEYVDEVTPAGALTGNSWPTTPYVIDVSGVAVDPVSGNVFISQDGSPQQVVEFAPNGTWIRTISVTGAGSVDPDGLAYDSVSMHFFLGEDTGDQIIEVDQAGLYVNSWAMGGLGISPEGLGLDNAAGTVFVSGGFDTIIYEVAGIISPSGFTISVDQFVANKVTTLSVTGATPSNNVKLAYSRTGGGPTPTPYGTVLLSPPFNILPDLTTDPFGNVSIRKTIPNAPGATIWIQAYDVGSGDLSNGLAETIQP